MTTQHVSRPAALVGSWLAVVSLAMPWVTRWEPRQGERELNDTAHGFWLATRTVEDHAPAEAWVAAVVLIGTLVVAVLAQVVAVSEREWPALLLALLVLVLIAVRQLGVEVHEPESRSDVEDLHVLVGGWYLWLAALVLGLVGAMAAAATDDRDGPA